MNGIHNGIRTSIWAMLLIWGLQGLMCRKAHAQPRHRRSHQVEATVQASAQTVGQPVHCPSPQLADDNARAGREHLRAGRAGDAVGAFSEARRQCTSPDVLELLGRAYEGLAATLVDDRARLEALDNALDAYREALELLAREAMPGLTPEGIRSRAAAIEPTVMALRQRLAAQQAIVEPPRPTVATCSVPQDACGTMACHDLRTDAANCGRCGNACGRGQTCAAGVCRAIVAVTPPIVTPPASSWFTPGRVAMLAGGVVAAGGLALLIPAQVEVSRLDGQRCEETSAARCYTYNNGDLRPETVRVIGAVTLGAGVAAVVTGAILQVTSSRSPERSPATRVSGYVDREGAGVILRRSF